MWMVAESFFTPPCRARPPPPVTRELCSTMEKGINLLVWTCWGGEGEEGEGEEGDGWLTQVECVRDKVIEKCNKIMFTLHRLKEILISFFLVSLYFKKFYLFY